MVAAFSAKAEVSNIHLGFSLAYLSSACDSTPLSREKPPNIQASKVSSRHLEYEDPGEELETESPTPCLGLTQGL